MLKPFSLFVISLTLSALFAYAIGTPVGTTEQCAASQGCQGPDWRKIDSKTVLCCCMRQWFPFDLKVCAIDIDVYEYVLAPELDHCYRLTHRHDLSETACTGEPYQTGTLPPENFGGGSGCCSLD